MDIMTTKWENISPIGFFWAPPEHCFKCFNLVSLPSPQDERVSSPVAMRKIYRISWRTEICFCEFTRKFQSLYFLSCCLTFSTLHCARELFSKICRREWICFQMNSPNYKVWIDRYESERGDLGHGDTEYIISVNISTSPPNSSDSMRWS